MSVQDEIKVNVSEVVDYSKLNGGFSAELREVVRRKIAVGEAKKRGVSISDEELQRSADLFRQINGIRTADATNGWLAERGLTLDALERFLEDNLLIFDLKSKLMEEYDKNSYFSTLERRNALMEAAYEEFLAKAAE